MRDIFKTKDVITLNENNVIIAFNNKQPIIIKKSEFTETEINDIITQRYCPACKTISSKGYYGTKHSWCKLARKFANEIGCPDPMSEHSETESDSEYESTPDFFETDTRY
jgi:hypothetical protein